MHQQQSTITVENSSTIQLQHHLPEGFMEESTSSEMRLEDQLDVSEFRDSSEIVETNLPSKHIVFF